jgi:predicted AAA+ superfamily ATPase
MERAAQALLEEYLTLFPCVAIVGPRQCGKTTLLGGLGDSWRVFDLERGSDFQAVVDDPDLFLSLHPGKVAIDEAPILPPLFQALRVALDADRGTTGRYIVTGSSSAELARAITESLAERAATSRQSPITGSGVAIPSPGSATTVDSARPGWTSTLAFMCCVTSPGSFPA